jgi:hypothetical protein
VNLTAAAAAQCVLGAGETDRIWFDDAVPGFGLRVRDSLVAIRRRRSVSL